LKQWTIIFLESFFQHFQERKKERKSCCPSKQNTKIFFVCLFLSQLIFWWQLLKLWKTKITTLFVGIFWEWELWEGQETWCWFHQCSTSNFYTCRSQNCKKDCDNLTVFFTLLWSLCEKAVHKMLTKLTPGAYYVHKQFTSSFLSN